MMRSIRRQLAGWLLLIMLAGLGLAGWLIYRQAQVEANELFDYQLQQMAAALPAEPFSSVLGSRRGDDDGVVIQIWSRSGVQLYYSHPRAPLAPRAELGFSTEHTTRGDWRVYAAVVGDNVVQLAQPMSVRNQLAADVAWRTLWPLVMLLPVLLLAVWITVGRGLAPLWRVARALDTRRPEALEPLPDRRLPREVKPLVRALNGLLSRLTAALDTQRAFVADAAHELRSPLAALKLQLQLLERARDETERQEALADLRHGVARATRLVQQLLALARSEPGATTTRGATRVDLCAVVGQCVAAYAARAADKSIDLGLTRADAACAEGDAEALAVMFGNVLDNAVKYTPPGGCVDVALSAHSERVQVDIVDTGPGIPAPERARVFDRFYRISGDARPAAEGAAGSGLGLAIVKQIAARHRASIVLDDGPNGVGLRVSVVFHRAPGVL